MAMSSQSKSSVEQLFNIVLQIGSETPQSMSHWALDCSSMLACALAKSQLPVFICSTGVQFSIEIDSSLLVLFCCSYCWMWAIAQLQYDCVYDIELEPWKLSFSHPTSLPRSLILPR